MSGISICDIDFEEWATLASSDHQGFEQLRQDMIVELIEKAPSRIKQRLHGLQWRIDQIREKNKDAPMAACLAISELMWDTFARLNDLLQYQAENGLSAPAPAPAIQADIISFPAKSEI